MKKKILSLVLVVAMLASMLVLAPVSGATAKVATLAFGDAVAVQGGTVTVDFKVTTNALTGLQFMFEYDASRLTYEKITWTSADEHGGAGVPADLTNGPASIFTKTGPYKVLSWATGVGVGALNLSEGATLATLTFSVKENAPLGDAYVKFVSLAEGEVQPNKLETGTASVLPADMDFVDGSVTILPAGYSTVSTLPTPVYLTDADLKYEFNADMTGWIITGKSGNYAAEGVVVFPSSIPDWTVNCDGTEYPVVGIASNAFVADAKATAFVIPETVTEIAPAAFLRCEATDYYVMNDACVIGEGAMGTAGAYSGTAWTSGPFIWDKDFVAGTTVAVTTIHGGANAKAYAEATYKTNATMKGTGFSYSSDKNLPTDAVLTFNGTEYLFVPGTEVTLPGMMEDENGRLVVEWNAGVVGKTITITEDIALKPARTIAKPQTSTEVGLKLADPLSMRFKATFGVDDYKTLTSLGTVELGMLITPARYVSYAGAFTKEALAEFTVDKGKPTEKTYTLGANAYVDVALNGYFSKTDDEYTFAARLENFSDTTLAKNPDFAAVMYATVTTADGATFTVYGDFNFAANTSVLEVAENTSTEGQTDPIKNAVAALIKTLKGEEA